MVADEVDFYVEIELIEEDDHPLRCEAASTCPGTEGGDLPVATHRCVQHGGAEEYESWSFCLTCATGWATDRIKAMRHG